MSSACRGCRTWPLSDPIVAVHQIGISACPRLMVVPIGKDASPISLQFFCRVEREVSKSSRKSGSRDDVKTGDAQRGLHMRFLG